MPRAKNRYTIHLQVEAAYRRRAPASALRAAAQATLAHQGAPAPGALSLRVTGDAALRRLNRDFLGQDSVTDVLSFPSNETEAGARYFGDIAVSLPRAAAQARAGSHPLQAELQLLVVHGVLHLLGHDHARPRDRARMWAAQAEILAALGAPILGPSTTTEDQDRTSRPTPGRPGGR